MLPYLASLDPRSHDQLVQAQTAYASLKAVGSILPDKAFEKNRALEALHVVLQAVPSLAVSEDAAAARQFVMLVKRVLKEQETAKIAEEAGDRSDKNAGVQQERGLETQSKEKDNTASQSALPVNDADHSASIESGSALRDGSGEEELVKLARKVVLQLLTHESATIRRAGYEALLEASTATKGQQAEDRVEFKEVDFLETVVGFDQVMVEILAHGLHHETTAKVRRKLCIEASSP